MAPRSREDSRDKDRDRDDGRGGPRGRGGRDRDERADDRGRGGGRDRHERDDDRGGSSRGSRDYEYAGRSSEENTQRAKQGSARYDSIFNEDLAYYSAKVGENCIRVIPWLNKKFPNYDELVEKYGNHWGIDAVIHRNVGADKGTYLCLDKMFGQPCPVCEVWRSDDEEDFKPSDRILCFVIDRKDEKAGPQLWNMPLGTSKDIQAASQDRQTGEWYPVEHPEEGFDIYFDREGEKDRTRYKRFELAKNPSPLHDNERRMDQWLDYVMEKPLPERLKAYDADYIEKVLAGKRRERDNDRDSDRSSRGRDRDDDRGRDRDSDRSSSRRRSDPDDDRERNSDRGRDSGRGQARDEPEGEFTRPSRRRGDDDGPSPETEGDSRGSRGRRSDPDEGSETRATRRGWATEDPPEDPEEAPDRGTPRGSRRAGVTGGKTERYRPGDGNSKGEDRDDGGGDDDTETAKENLRRVGRRRG
jgi:hypothetical protein